MLKLYVCAIKTFSFLILATGKHLVIVFGFGKCPKRTLPHWLEKLTDCDIQIWTVQCSSAIESIVKSRWYYQTSSYWTKDIQAVGPESWPSIVRISNHIVVIGQAQGSRFELRHWWKMCMRKMDKRRICTLSLSARTGNDELVTRWRNGETDSPLL